MKDLNCYLHTPIEAEYRCARCGAPICATCYDVTLDHHCAKCYRKELGKEAKLAKETLAKVKGELKGIYWGLIGGAVIFTITTLMFYFDQGIETLPFCLIWGFFGTMVLGSFSAIGNFIANGVEGTGEDGWWISIAMLLVCIIAAPITTILRIVRRRRDVRTITEIYEMDNAVIKAVERFVAKAKEGNERFAASNQGVTPGANIDTLTSIKKRII